MATKTKTKSQPKSKSKPKRDKKKKREGKASEFSHHFKLIVQPAAGKEFEAVCTMKTDNKDYLPSRNALAQRLGGLIIAHKLPLADDPEDQPLLVLNGANMGTIEIEAASDEEAEWLEEEAKTD